MVKFDDIEDAFLFVSSSPYGENSAILCKDTGVILYRSEMGGINEINDEELDWDNCVEIPHKNDLDLGSPLVFLFAETHLPDEIGRVEHFFRKEGAYRHFKALLESKGMLETWYEFENQRQKQALLEWCQENELEVSE